MEVMIVVAIIGILAAVAIPNMGGWLEKRRLDAAAREMFSDLQRARSEAITRARNVTIVIDTDDDTYLVRESQNPGNVIVPLKTIPEGIDLASSLPNTLDTTGFTMRGFSSRNQDVSLTLTSARASRADNQRVITITRGGTVTIEP